ncbi:hypothetical protein GOP47_0000094 [Adiantum capillus-veneris]|uniref:C17orf113 probable zinc finger domain-containing protein n=1 Tax=Adiantum capillus-veneris TaxID=13818 RepID=A0A9D4VCD8_ADICA|nr:hypothetical protein GOP47_0000094 [Adiantum capillus-veneris]
MASSRPLKKTKKQKTLEESMGLHALPKERKGDTLESSDPEIGQGEVSEKKRHQRVFLESWKIDHPWAYCIINSKGKERSKCKWCNSANKKTPFVYAEGSKSLQKAALWVHENSDEHHEAKAMWKEQEKRSMVPLSKHIAEIHDAEMERIVTCMQIAWYVLRRFMPIEEYAKQCGFQKFMGTPNMTIVNEYSSYSPWYALQVDESTDVSTMQYMILYVTYIENAGNGEICTKFIDLLRPKSASAESLFDALVSYLKLVDFPMQKLVGIATDGATVMSGQHTGLVTRLREKVPHLISFHCIAHRQALAAGDAFKTNKEFKYVDKLARKVYEWTSRSAKRHVFLGEAGQVMVSIVRIMPALLTVLKSEDATLYGYLTTYKVQFLFHFFADVLGELNVLNSNFQEEHPDIASIGDHIESVMESLRLSFFGDIFSADTRYMEDFLKKVSAQMGLMIFKDNANVVHSHSCTWDLRMKEMWLLLVRHLIL